MGQLSTLAKVAILAGLLVWGSVLPAAGDGEADAGLLERACTWPEGEWIALPEHYAADLVSPTGGRRVYLSATPGAEPGRSYGLVDDQVEAMATACLEGTGWVQVKFPAAAYGEETTGWVRASFVTLR